MAEVQLDKQGKPPQEYLKDTILRLTENVYKTITIKYDEKKDVFDVLEGIIKRIVEHDGSFDCSHFSLGEKIFAVHDVENPVTNLLIGPYSEYRDTVLEKMSNRISSLIYELGMKEEIIHILFSILLKEMKNRFSKKKSGYVFVGVEGIREEGLIKLK